MYDEMNSNIACLLFTVFPQLIKYWNFRHRKIKSILVTKLTNWGTVHKSADAPYQFTPFRTMKALYKLRTNSGNKLARDMTCMNITLHVLFNDGVCQERDVLCAVTGGSTVSGTNTHTYTSQVTNTLWLIAVSLQLGSDFTPSQISQITAVVKCTACKISRDIAAPWIVSFTTCLCLVKSFFFFRAKGGL